MATRSTIWIRNEDGSRRGIYCHWDGYPSNNGKILKEHFNTPEKINQLIDGGSLSSLEAKINPTEGSGHNFDKPEPGVCIYYARDRGEDLSIYTNHRKELREEYNYIFDVLKGVWYCNGHKLTDRMIERN